MQLSSKYICTEVKEEEIKIILGLKKDRPITPLQKLDDPSLYNMYRTRIQSDSGSKE